MEGSSVYKAHLHCVSRITQLHGLLTFEMAAFQPIPAFSNQLQFAAAYGYNATQVLGLSFTYNVTCNSEHHTDPSVP